MKIKTVILKIEFNEILSAWFKVNNLIWKQ